MALDDRQRNTRRAQRRRAQRQRTLKLRLIAAAVVLVLCAAAIFVISRASRGSGSAPTETRAPTEAAGSTEPAPTEPTTTVNIAVAGDLIVCDETVSAGGETYRYDSVLSDVSPLLAAADLAIVDFEGNVAGQPYGTATASAPAQMLTALAQAGVDYVQLANSRAIANGLTGLSATIDAVRAAGMEPLGVYATNQEADSAGGYTICEVRGVKIALVAFTKGMDSMALPDGSERCVNLLYSDYATTYQAVDERRITAVLDAAAAEAPDITIALLHWGSEYNDMRSDSQERIRDLMLAHGVDAIIGTHPHYVQPIVYDAAAGTLVCYSLGDFFGSARRVGTDYSLLLNLTVIRDNATGETKLVGYTVTPLYLLRDDGGTRIVQLRQALANFEANYVGKVSQEIYDAMTAALERITVRTAPEFFED